MYVSRRSMPHRINPVRPKAAAELPRARRSAVAADSGASDPCALSRRSWLAASLAAIGASCGWLRAGSLPAAPPPLSNDGRPSDTSAPGTSGLTTSSLSRRVRGLLLGGLLGDALGGPG